jgi:hypothetical protein
MCSLTSSQNSSSFWPAAACSQRQLVVGECVERLDDRSADDMERLGRDAANKGGVVSAIAQCKGSVGIGHLGWSG